jgi:hypothetical protein
MNFGLGNRITPFKKRKINLKKPVLVYRALNRKGRVYSLKQNGLVVGHSTCLMLADAEFIVSKAGQKRARETKQRNVHAYIKGKICLRGRMGLTAADGETHDKNQLPAHITYNPFKYDYFICDNLTAECAYVFGAFAVAINNKGVWACMLETDPK